MDVVQRLSVRTNQTILAGIRVDDVQTFDFIEKFATNYWRWVNGWHRLSWFLIAKIKVECFDNPLLEVWQFSVTDWVSAYQQNVIKTS